MVDMGVSLEVWWNSLLGDIHRYHACFCECLHVKLEISQITRKHHHTVAREQSARPYEQFGMVSLHVP